MGPGAGTASLAGTGLGFANVVRQGPVGVVAAAGTGAQEVMALLHRWGIGVSHVIGLGGRDLSDEIDGRMARLAIHALRNDPQTEVILFVSKPPSQRVAREVMALADGSPMVAAFMGIDMTTVTPPGVILANTLESGVLRTLEVLGESLPDTSAIAGPDVASALAKISADRTLIRVSTRVEPCATRLLLFLPKPLRHRCIPTLLSIRNSVCPRLLTAARC